MTVEKRLAHGSTGNDLFQDHRAHGAVPTRRDSLIRPSHSMMIAGINKDRQPDRLLRSAATLPFGASEMPVKALLALRHVV